MYLTKTNNKNDMINITNRLLNDSKYEKYTILDHLKYVSKKYPNKCALKILKSGINDKREWKSITYREYYDKIVNFAESINYWLGKKVNIAIIGFNSPGWFIAHLGCAMNMGISTGIYHTSSPEICEKIIKRSKSEIIVVEDDHQLKKLIGIDISNIKLIIYYSHIKHDIIKNFDIPVLSMGNFMSKKTEFKIKHFKLSDVVTRVFSSNVMSNGILISHKNIMSSIAQFLNLINSKSTIRLEEEQFISYLPLNHIVTQIMDIYIPIMTLGTVWFADKNSYKTKTHDETSLENIIFEVKPTIFVGVPYIWDKIVCNIEKELNENIIKGSIAKTFLYWKIIQKIGLDRCKLPISTIDKISEYSKKYLELLGLQIYDCYSMSETTGFISVSLPSLYRLGSVGVPLMNFKISNDREIIVKGDNCVDDDWLKTGDLGYVDQNGFLYIIGKKNESINDQVEKRLKTHLGQYFCNIIVVNNKKITKNKIITLTILFNPSIKLPSDIDQIISAEIQEINSNLQPNTYIINKWNIIYDIFKIGEELTPTYKIKKDFIVKKYKKMI